MTEQPRRVLLVDDDGLVLAVGGDLLHAGGYAVQLLMYPTLTVPTAQQFKPDLIVLDLNMPVLNGREVQASLKAFADLCAVPVILITAPMSPRDQVRALISGAVDLWAKPFTPEHVDRLGEIFTQLERLAAHPPADAREKVRMLLLAFFKREQSDGTLVVNPATPFEGRAIFSRGAFSWARIGPLANEAALDEMLALEDATWRWEEGVLEPPVALEAAPFAPKGYRPRVLLVDDDPALRKLYVLQLQRAGYEVAAAENGEDGHRLATESPFDVIVADLNMPVLDGWGMLKRLKTSARTREVPVLVLSAHDDYRETLKAARSGAHDYLRKTGRADELLRRVGSIVAPRATVFEGLRTGQGFTGLEVATVGPQWLLKTVGEQDCSGTLEATDDWGSYRLKVDRGQLTEGIAEAGAKKALGAHAVRAFVVSRSAKASFTPMPARADESSGNWLVEAVDDASRHVASLEQRITEERLSRATQLVVEPELAALFERVGNAADLRILRAIAQQKVAPALLAEHLSLPQDSIDAGLKELLRRGVVRL